MHLEKILAAYFFRYNKYSTSEVIVEKVCRIVIALGSMYTTVQVG